jgi:hypothetical protein
MAFLLVQSSTPGSTSPKGLGILKVLATPRTQAFKLSVPVFGSNGQH